MPRESGQAPASRQSLADCTSLLGAEYRPRGKANHRLLAFQWFNNIGTAAAMLRTTPEFTGNVRSIKMFNSFASAHRSAVSLVAAFFVSGIFLAAALPVVPVA